MSKIKMEIKKRIKLLKEKIKGIALERKELLQEQRVYRRELNELKEEGRNL